MTRPLLLAACLLLAAAAPPPPAARPMSRLDLPWWSARLAEKARALRDGPVDLVWYGDSITQDWEQAGPEPWRDFAPVWQRFYGRRQGRGSARGAPPKATAPVNRFPKACLWRVQGRVLAFACFQEPR